MRFYEPIAVGLFVVTVLAASYMLGKRIGYETGYTQGFERANTDAFAEGHVSGFNEAIDALVKAGNETMEHALQTQGVATN